MTVTCRICASPSLRGQLDADLVRKLTLKALSQKYGLNGRIILRHIKHLPEKLEGEASASRPSLYIGRMNVSVLVALSEEGEGVAANEAVPGN
jgi:hypothetical protein